MAGAVNKVILVGRLGGDPEIRRTQDGRPVASFSLATSERWRDKTTGEKRERTEWHRIVIFNEGLCELAEKYLKKGKLVFIEGSLGTRKWTDNAKIERWTTEVVLKAFRGELQMLDAAERMPAADSAADYGSEKTAPAAKPEINDEIPL